MNKNIPYRNPMLSPEERAADLVSRMTIPEKIAQMLTYCGYRMYERSGDKITVTDEFKKLSEEYPGFGLASFNRADWYSKRNWQTGMTPELAVSTHNLFQRWAVENSRLGIPRVFGGAIHGVYALGGSVFPTGIGQASTWNRALVSRASSDTAEELLSFTSAAWQSGPTQDLARDPRWSRVEETFGEDPFLSAELTAAHNRGGIEFGGNRIMPAIRHFICHGDSEGGRNGSAVHAGIHELLNIHMRPFEAGIKSGALNLMVSYNWVDGVPSVANGALVDGILRKRWGFKGLVIGDAWAISSLVPWGFVSSLGEAAAMSVKNGTDQCCWEGEQFGPGLREALEKGLLSEEEMNVSVRRILELKFHSGVFEHPYMEDESAPVRVMSSPAHKKTALAIAEESIVLLSNPKKILPLKNVRTIAVIGPNADNFSNQLGDYTAPQRSGDVMTVRNGFEALAKECGFQVRYAHGCKVRAMDRSGFPEAIALAKESDAVVLVLGGSSVPDQKTKFKITGAAEVDSKSGEQEKDCGEGYDRMNLRPSGVQLELLDAIRALGKPLVTVMIQGRPMILNEIVEKSDAVLCAWYPGMMGGLAVAEIISGRVNPSGKLPVSFPRSEGQLPVFYNKYLDPGDYADGSASPLFPFGFGLSYTTFEYSDARIDDRIASVVVRNSGGVDGAEVVEMFVSDVKFSIARPTRELRGFQKVFLRAGESKKVSFPLTEKELGFYNRDQQYVVEPGDFRIGLGGSLDTLLWLDYRSA